jgi:hypothetical protein
MDLEREGVKIDWVRMLEVFERSNILLLVAAIANSFVGECMLGRGMPTPSRSAASFVTSCC